MKAADKALKIRAFMEKHSYYFLKSANPSLLTDTAPLDWDKTLAFLNEGFQFMSSFPSMEGIEVPVLTRESLGNSYFQLYHEVNRMGGTISDAAMANTMLAEVEALEAAGALDAQPGDDRILPQDDGSGKPPTWN